MKITAFRMIAAAATAMLLAGCVSTKETVFTEKADPEKALEYRVELARKYIGEGDWDNAKRNLRLASEIDPKNAEVHEAFALVYQSTGEFELAEDSYQTALRLDKNFSRARNNYAAYLYSQGRYKDAQRELEIVVQDTLYPGRPRAFVNLGLCRVQNFEPQGAEEAFRRALTMDRTNSIALLELAQLRYDAADFTTAGQYYDTYRTVTRQQSARGLWLGIRLARQQGDLNAEGSYALALENLYPTSAEYEAYKRTL
ncbi:type IV pilus biogenesis/stability protein PilW [Halioglobus sp. HI00S01]|uniref:type IV pilus biogenesis/stability protein PilW n=1 Tax=Halioglobus sp. HI00S01 TaxID=1822214 RepID=UPI0012E920B7|nr:type IV pilus biogenesis/stability protein PilW [Halioglobus sp. HI00S01]